MSHLTPYFCIAQAISTLLAPDAEVVIHDLKTRCIAAIFNPFSPRKRGDESLLEGLEAATPLPDVFPIYSKVNPDGRKMKSISSTIKDQKGKAIGLFCINLDISRWESMHQFLEVWLQGVNSQPQTLFKDDWREKINTYVAEYLKREGISLKALSSESNRQLVLLLHREGAFKAKNAASYIADVLNLSRATIYNYLRT